MILKTKYPTFLVRVNGPRLETDGLWHRTAQPGEEWVPVTEITTLPGLRLALWPLWLVNPDTGQAVVEYCKAGDPRLCVRADQLQGGPVYECLMLDHAGVVVQ